MSQGIPILSLELSHKSKPPKVVRYSFLAQLDLVSEAIFSRKNIPSVTGLFDLQ